MNAYVVVALLLITSPLWVPSVLGLILSLLYVAAVTCFFTLGCLHIAWCRITRRR